MDSELYTQIQFVGKPVSRIICGLGGLKFAMGGDQTALLDEVFSAGVNTFDTARLYLFSEQTLGRWIERRGLREQVVVISKCAHPSLLGRRVNPAAIRKDLEGSCRALRTDYIDIYLLHRDDERVEVGPLVETLNDLHIRGRIGAFGGSNWSHPRIQAANKYAAKHGLTPFTVSSPQYGLAEQVYDPYGGCVTIGGAANMEARDWYAANQMPVIAYSSLGSGFFSGKLKADDVAQAGRALSRLAWKAYASQANFERLRRAERLAAQKGCTVAQIALAWLLVQPARVFPVVSSARAVRMAQNVQAVKIDLSADEARYLDMLSDEL